MTLVAAFALDPGDEVTISHLAADGRGHKGEMMEAQRDLFFFVCWVIEALKKTFVFTKSFFPM